MYGYALATMEPCSGSARGESIHRPEEASHTVAAKATNLRADYESARLTLGTKRIGSFSLHAIAAISASSSTVAKVVALSAIA